MEFDRSRVYTALNADELKLGSKVICANTLDSLKCKVNEDRDITEIKEIRAECDERRFRTEFSGLWPLVYLISEPEEKKLKWTDLKIGDVVCCGGKSCMITSIDTDDDTRFHICFNDEWYSDDELEEWEKVETE